LLGILGFVSFFVGKNSVEKPNKFYVIGAVLISQLILTVVLFYFFHSRFANKLREDIGQIVDSKELQINIDDSIASKSFRDSLTVELKNIGNVFTNHTGPDFEINMDLITKDKKIHLLLGRDSGDSTLYWIYVKDYRTSRNNDIGKIRTKLLNYLK
jgi:hypothetical protein